MILTFNNHYTLPDTFSFLFTINYILVSSPF